MLKSFIFPFVGLLADVALIYFRGFPPTIFLIAAVVVFVVCNAWLYTQVEDDTDNQYVPAAMAAIIPALIIGLATS